MSKIFEIYDYCVAGHENLLFTSEDIDTIPETMWLSSYKHSPTSYDVMIDFMYSQRAFNDRHSRDVMESLVMFRRLWESFVDIHNTQFQKAYDTLLAEYNPLWNVDGTETTSYTDKETVLPTATMTTKKNSFQDTDTSTMIPDVEVSGSTITTNEKAHSMTVERKGNIGVTSSQNLINQELELRKSDFLMDKIKQFINEFTYWE